MKVPEPRRLKSGTWFIQLRLGGESIPVSALTRSDCIKQAQLIKAQHRADAHETKYKTDKTARDLMSDYIDSIRKTASPSTIRGYATIRDHRFASIADKPVSKIKNWQRVIDVEADLTSAKTLKNAWSFLRTSMRYAGMTPPDVRLPQLVPADPSWLEPDEVLRFVDLVHGKSFEVAALLALHGLRRSEILAMTFGKIDLSANTISVHGAAVMSEDNVLVHKPTNKNASSRRVVPIMIPALVDAIRRTAPHQPDGLVYPFHANTLRIQINQLCRDNDLPQVGVHGLRHSFASLAFYLGLQEQETMELGGWADYQTMHKIYTHLAAAARLKSQNKMAAFFGANANQDANKNKNA